MISSFFIIVLCSFLVACGGEAASEASGTTSDTSTDNTAQQTTNQQSAPTTVPPTVETANTTNENSEFVARVNGVGIPVAIFDRAYARRIQDTNVTDLQAVAGSVIDALIEQELINQAATQLGIVVTDQDVEGEINQLKTAVETDEAWQAFLDLNAYTEEEMYQAQRDSLLTQRLRDQISVELQGNVEQVQARHILVRTESDAQDILTLLSNGEDFISLASQYSIDTTTRDNGGLLGWFTRDELMDGRLAEVAFSLESNQIAGPVATQLGYHIIQTLEKANRPIEIERMPMLMENVFVNWLSLQLAGAEIERYR